MVICFGFLIEKTGIGNFIKTPLAFFSKGKRNLKCYVAPAKSLAPKRVCCGRQALNKRVCASETGEKRCRLATTAIKSIQNPHNNLQPEYETLEQTVALGHYQPSE